VAACSLCRLGEDRHLPSLSKSGLSRQQGQNSANHGFPDAVGTQHQHVRQRTLLVHRPVASAIAELCDRLRRVLLRALQSRHTFMELRCPMLTVDLFCLSHIDRPTPTVGTFVNNIATRQEWYGQTTGIFHGCANGAHYEQTMLPGWERCGPAPLGNRRCRRSYYRQSRRRHDRVPLPESFATGAPNLSCI
jgi:hypothetical protein